MKDKLPVLQADEAACGIALAALFDQMLKAQPCQPGRLDSIKRGRIAALLQMPENSRANVEHIPAFLLKKRANKTCGIDQVGSFVTNDKPQPLAQIEALLERMDILLQ